MKPDPRDSTIPGPQPLLAHALLAEEERRRLAIELHDQLGHIFTALEIKLESVRREVSGAIAAQLGDAVELVQHAADAVREVTLDLRPAMLDDLGLAAALRWFADRFARQTGIALHLSIGALPPLDDAQATVCFRVAQEAFTNIARHAHARNVWLDVHVANDTLRLLVRDDGIGFDVVTARRNAYRGESLGLLGMQERVASVDGTLQWTSARGAGTTLCVRIPLAEAA